MPRPLINNSIVGIKALLDVVSMFIPHVLAMSFVFRYYSAANADKEDCSAAQHHRTAKIKNTTKERPLNQNLV